MADSGLPRSVAAALAAGGIFIVGPTTAAALERVQVHHVAETDLEAAARSDGMPADSGERDDVPGICKSPGPTVRFPPLNRL